MRKPIFALLAALALVCAGCGSSGPSSSTDQPSAAPLPPPATSITGSVSLSVKPGAPALTDAAKLELALVDISQQPALPIARQQVQPLGALPIQFKLPFKPADVINEDIYEIRATIVDGQRRYTMPLSYPVLTQGRNNTAEIVLQPEPTPSEQMLGDFEALKATIGGMSIRNGTSLSDSESHGWQAFRKDGELLFVRENVDYTAGGRTETDYAYSNGKPFVVVQKHRAAAGAPVDSIQRAGWTAAGKVVVHEETTGGKTILLADKDVDGLRKQAEAAFKRVGGNKY
ncbi:MAG TPA: YbaY family lipoprotein [Rhodanobacteraceae bacterium]|nr:YbaY family lipoprotein [Rhodanobacteraceae bacterium]